MAIRIEKGIIIPSLDTTPLQTVTLAGTEIFLPKDPNIRIILEELSKTLSGEIPYPEDILKQGLDLRSPFNFETPREYYRELVHEAAEYTKLAGFKIVRTTLEKDDGSQISSLVLQKIQPKNGVNLKK